MNVAQIIVTNEIFLILNLQFRLWVFDIHVFRLALIY